MSFFIPKTTSFKILHENFFKNYENESKESFLTSFDKTSSKNIAENLSEGSGVSTKINLFFSLLRKDNLNLSSYLRKTIEIIENLSLNNSEKLKCIYSIYQFLKEYSGNTNEFLELFTSSILFSTKNSSEHTLAKIMSDYILTPNSNSDTILSFVDLAFKENNADLLNSFENLFLNLELKEKCYSKSAALSAKIEFYHLNLQSNLDVIEAQLLKDSVNNKNELEMINLVKQNSLNGLLKLQDSSVNRKCQFFILRKLFGDNKKITFEEFNKISQIDFEENEDRIVGIYSETGIALKINYEDKTISYSSLKLKTQYPSTEDLINLKNKISEIRKCFSSLKNKL